MFHFSAREINLEKLDMKIQKKGSNTYFTEDKSRSKKTQSNELVATSPLILRSDFPTKSKGQSNTKGFPKTNKAPIASFPASDIASLCWQANISFQEYFYAFISEQMWFVSGDDGGLPLFTPKPQPHHITPMSLFLFFGFMPTRPPTTPNTITANLLVGLFTAVLRNPILLSFEPSA